MGSVITSTVVADFPFFMDRLKKNIPRLLSAVAGITACTTGGEQSIIKYLVLNPKLITGSRKDPIDFSESGPYIKYDIYTQISVFNRK